MPTLLVVDDEELLGRNIARYLFPRGWNVECALSLTNALLTQADTANCVL